jgi:hypothetical protein
MAGLQAGEIGLKTLYERPDMGWGGIALALGKSGEGVGEESWPSLHGSVFCLYQKVVFSLSLGKSEEGRKEGRKEGVGEASWLFLQGYEFCILSESCICYITSQFVEIREGLGRQANLSTFHDSPKPFCERETFLS